MGSSGGGSAPANTSQTVTQQLPGYVQPYAEQAMQRGVELSNQPYQAYTGQRMASMTPEHEIALGGITNRAISGSPGMNATNQNLAATMRGDFLSPGSNPWLDQTFAKGMEGIKASVTPTFGHMQAFGGNTGYNEAMSRGAADLATNVYGGNYQAERERQIKGMALAPQIAQQDYSDAQALLGVGDVRRQYSQDQLNMNYEDWLRQQNHPYAQLDVLANAIRGGIGGGGTTTSQMPNPYQPNAAAGMLGGGLLGAGLAQMGGVNPLYGAGAGAALPWILG